MYVFLGKPKFVFAWRITMKSLRLSIFVIFIILILTGCNQPATPEKEPEEEKSIAHQIVEYTTYLGELENEYVVTNSNVYILPYVKYNYDISDSLYVNQLFHVDNRYLFKTADGEEEYWLLLSRFDDGQLLGVMPLETGIKQVWVREKDTLQYNVESKGTLSFPVWIKEGVKDVSGNILKPEDLQISDFSEPIMIGRNKDGTVSITRHGGSDPITVKIEDIIFPDVDKYGK